MKKHTKIIVVDVLIVVVYFVGFYPIETLPTVLLLFNSDLDVYGASLILFIILSLHAGAETYLLGWRFDQATNTSFGKKFVGLVKNWRLFRSVYEDVHHNHVSRSLIIIYLFATTPACLKFATFICATSKNKYAIAAMYAGILTKSMLCSWLGDSYLTDLIHAAVKFL